MTSQQNPENMTRSWHTSSYSGGGGNGCVEHGGYADGTQGVRDSKDPERKTSLTFSPNTWQSFVNFTKIQQV